MTLTWHQTDRRAVYPRPRYQAYCDDSHLMRIMWDPASQQWHATWLGNVAPTHPISSGWLRSGWFNTLAQAQTACQQWWDTGY